MPRSSIPGMVDEGIGGPVARVVVDVNLPHLDREFDYLVPADLDALAVPGSRVRVRFAGRLVDGFVTARLAVSDHEGQLARLHKVVSSEPVLTPAVHQLLRAVADHYAGTVADMLRLAIPPRHAATEAAERPAPPPPALQASGANSLVSYPHGESFLSALAAGRHARATWHVAAVHSNLGDPFAGLVAAAQAALSAGRGAIILVPDQRTLQRLQAVVETICGKGTFAVLAAELGPSVRYRHFLAVARGQQQLVIGTRAAVYAPVRDLGFIGVWDDGSDQYADLRAPYPHSREVAVLRATQAGAGLLFAAHARSVECQSWVESGWLGEIGSRPADLRQVTPVVRVAGASDWQLQRDPRARETRLPREVFDVVRAGLAAGPVLVQVPLAGYVRGAVCADCGTAAACAQCSGRLRGEPGRTGMRLTCAWCGPPAGPWRCSECGSAQVRAAGVGSTRTAEELGKAFPGTRVVLSAGERIVPVVSEEPALVVCTPGAEPIPAAGYAAAVLLDAAAALTRPDLRAGEESLRRWLAAVALVRPAREGGTVLVVGPSEATAVQALVRADPAPLASRELAGRREAGFPPASRFVVVEGPSTAVAEFRTELRLPAGASVVAYLPPPAEQAGATTRLTLRAPLSVGRRLVAEVKAAAAVRTARKDEGALRIRVDPQVLG